MNYMVFSKYLAGEPLDVVGRRLVAAGIGAIDLTVRPGGIVEPARAADELPQAIEALRRGGCRVGMITTGICSVEDGETVLRTAAQCGITHYKLGYWPYREFGTLAKLRAEVIARLKPLAALGAELKITAGFHNHSDTFFGGQLADVAHVLDAVDSPLVGAYLDPCHAVIEGGSRGWQMGLELIIDRVVMLAVKDFRWLDNKSAYAGGRRHSVVVTPLASGNTPWPAVIKILKARRFDGPISLHSEYRTDHSEPWCETPADLVEQTARDLQVFEQWWKES
jgi:sugar phosphate isomerase/epimerase